MKLTTVLTVSVLCVGLSGFGPGCANKPEASKEKAAVQTGSFKQSLNAMPALIDAAVADMRAATTGQNPTRGVDIQRFQFSLGKMKEAANTVAISYQKALTNSNAFYDDWNREARQMTSAQQLEVQKMIGKRLETRADGMGFFDGARTSFLKLSKAMSELEANLARDPSEQNVVAQSDLVGKAMVSASDTRAYIDRLNDVLNAAASMK